jgi:uncharacterized protein YyaL (SSP411 family)
MTAVNRLASARSAYLRSAAHQPIDWYPWGEEAFARARVEDRPVLLDIGAVWCHWCHVMDAESYEDASLADYVNRQFICVKVDRDERPDVDLRYQRAVQAITGQGGWPLTAFLTPDGEVFYGGTYFPPDGRHGRPGFRTVLTQIRQTYDTQRERIREQAAAISRILHEHLDEGRPGAIRQSLLAEATDGMARLFDRRHGGFGGQPKFPHPATLGFLLHRWWEEPRAWVRDMIDGTLLGMARGGIRDQIGGGFHRYSVDARWIVPHFEKMSYDNSELLRVYVDAGAAFGIPEYAEVARGIVGWVREVLADPAGGYGASQDADVGLDDDGNYFTWTADEAGTVLTPEELAIAVPYYDIGTAGEMHHDPARNVLFIAEPLQHIARRLEIGESEAASRLASVRRKLAAARTTRTAPFVDHTRYTCWNTMMAGALLHAAPVLQDDWAREHARRTLARLRAEQDAIDAVAHAPGGQEGLLDDQVQTAQAALDAYEDGAGLEWLDWAERLMDRVWRDYWDAAGGGLFDSATGRGGEGLLYTRAKPVQDAPTPSGNGVAALVTARLHELTGEPRWRERRDAVVGAFAGRLAELGLYGATMLSAADWCLNPATHLVIVGESGDQEAELMHRRALATFVPRRVVQRIHPGEDPAGLTSAVRGMLAVGAGTRAYACAGTSCSPPASSDQAWAETLAGLRPPA